MFVVDTNFLIEAAIEDYPNHQGVRELLEKWRRGNVSWHCTWSIFYEFLRVTTHRQILPKPLTSEQAWSFLNLLLESSGFSMLVETLEHGGQIKEMASSMGELKGNLWHDAHIVALMRENGIREIYTFDVDFHRFKDIRVINPFK
ncbi:MAG: type II toxin-antitoxin system VapC family toxin [Deltaproteobacteria bacterium]|nr:type II toxin-antitoxin system VapC family toxin [Deltaproteobacteria bacterium]